MIFNIVTAKNNVTMTFFLFRNRTIRVESGQGRPADRMSWIQQILADWPGASSLSVLFLVLYWYCVRSSSVYIDAKVWCPTPVSEVSDRANINGRKSRKMLVGGMSCGYCKSTRIYSTTYVVYNMQESPGGTTSPLGHRGKKPRPVPGRTVQHSLNVNKSRWGLQWHSREGMEEMGITS